MRFAGYEIAWHIWEMWGYRSIGLSLLHGRGDKCWDAAGSHPLEYFYMRLCMGSIRATRPRQFPCLVVRLDRSGTSRNPNFGRRRAFRGSGAREDCTVRERSPYSAATTPACAFKGPLPTFATIFQRPLDVEKPAVAERVTG